MQERVRPTLPIEIGSSDRLEAHAFVEAQRLGVRFVHVGRDDVVLINRAVEQGLPNPFSVVLRVYEKRFQVGAVHQHEPQRDIGVAGDDKLRGREEGSYVRLDGNAVLRRQEVVRRVDGPTPDLHEPINFIGSA